ncbi:site-specific integrase [Paraglaciecola aquimarina]|uniref:Site-specific integrase n=1 Tax=Paraglaciecola aquimarina TaxID=1235557 RepID=A0ABU3T0G3_9ALTE|nr:site-specific integrase [Paraglaciecola aquimarina]MDU0355751.1 site-specific integrase [Paraglaciecola aquimarina]
MKNCTLVSLPNGKKRLVDNRDSRSSMPIDAFTTFQDKLISRYQSQATVTAYRGHVARFIDYLIECGVFLTDIPPTEDTLNKVIGYYPELLSRGAKSKNLYIQKVADSLNRTPVTSSSEAQAAINFFLEYVVDLASNTRDYAADVLKENIDNNAELFLALKRNRNVSHYEIQRIKQNSVLGANLRRIKPFKKTARLRSHINNSTSEIKDFPIEHIEELVANATNMRDKAFWLVQAAGGLRQSEALTLKWDLIDFKNQQIRVEDPNNLRGSEDYETSQRQPWKGRNTAIVYILPVLKNLLFEALLELRRLPPTSETGLVFLKLDSNGYGSPLSEASNNALNDAFRAAQKRIGMTDEYTLHSLRHFYGVFLKNYFPDVERGVLGLTDGEIMLMMGHANLSSTYKYARTKRDKIIMKMELLDREIRGHDSVCLASMVAKWHMDKAMQLDESIKAKFSFPENKSIVRNFSITGRSGKNE